MSAAVMVKLAPSAGPQTRARVLMISYDASLLLSRKAVLGHFGYHVRSSGDVEHVLALIGVEVFHIVLLDHTVPAPHRRRVMHAARERHITVLMIETVAVWELEADARIDGFDGPAKLLEKLATMLALRPTAHA